MKTLSPKIVSILAVIMIMASLHAFAQQNDPSQQTTTPLSTAPSAQSSAGKTKSSSSPSTASKGDASDMNQQYQKFQDVHKKIQDKATHTSDPQMKSDLNALDAKMNKFDSDMQNYMKNKGAGGDQDQAKANLKAQMSDIKKDYETIRKKYGDQKSSSKGSSSPQPQSDTPKQ